MEYKETIWAEQRPFLYGGGTCTEHKNGWTISGLEQEEEDNVADVKLAANIFPPGTKISIKEPVCPICASIPSKSADKVKVIDEGETTYEYIWSCEDGCSFNWRKWVNDEYA